MGPWWERAQGDHWMSIFEPAVMGPYAAPGFALSWQAIGGFEGGVLGSGFSVFVRSLEEERKARQKETTKTHTRILSRHNTSLSIPTRTPSRHLGNWIHVLEIRRVAHEILSRCYYPRYMAVCGGLCDKEQNRSKVREVK
jgi:hypothetical protein